MQERRFIWNQASYTYEIVILPNAGSKTADEASVLRKIHFQLILGRNLDFWRNSSFYTRKSMFLQIALSKWVRATISSEKFNNFLLLLCRNIDLYEINRLILTKLWYCQTLFRKRAVGRILTKNTCSVNSRQKPRFLEEFKFLHTKTDVSPNRSFEISPSDDFLRKIQ